MTLRGDSRSARGVLELSHRHPFHHKSHTALGSNQGCRDGSPATNSSRYGTACLRSEVFLNDV